MFDVHLSGKKHVAQVKKLEEEAKFASKGKDQDNISTTDAEHEVKNEEQSRLRSKMFCEKALSHDLRQEQEAKWLHPEYI